MWANCLKIMQITNKMVSDKGQLKAGASSNKASLDLLLAGSSASLHLTEEYLVFPPNSSCHKSLLEDTGAN